MSKSKNLGGFITLPIPDPSKFPMTFEVYKKKYGIDLMDIFADNPGNAVPVFKVKKPIFTEDVDRYYGTIPLILPIVTNVGVSEGAEVLQIIHGVLNQSGFYMVVNWTNKTLSANEY